MNDNHARRLAVLAPKVMGAFHHLSRRHPGTEHLTMRQYQALVLLQTSGRMTLTDLCKKLNLAASTGTELVNRMISAGLLEKSPEITDRRQVLILLTEKGKSLLEQRKQQMTDMFEKFMLPFGEQDRNNFVQAFEDIWGIVKKYYARE
ncbi:winged helix DNA-binding protein [candidate division KSB1 bacterium]|nr:winged helix DNA-binding protein [candidate division KSB1 bacterium]